MTPAELTLCADAYKKRMQAEQELISAQNYNLANLIRAAVWAKHMPSFDKVRPAKKKEKKSMTDEEMFKKVQALNRMFGGSEE